MKKDLELSLWSKKKIIIAVVVFYMQLHAQDCEIVDSVIVSLPFFHSNILNESSGDDWNFENDGYNDGFDYAYEFTLTTQRSLYIDTCDPLTDFDTILSIKDGCGDDASLAESDDGTQDFCPEASVTPPYYASIIDSITLEAGTYYIILDGWSGNIGNYAIAVGTLPEILGSSIADDDSYIDIYFSEGMYTEATGVGAMVASDFEFTLDQNGGTATGVEILSLSNTIGEPLVGGEDTVRFVINIQGESTGLEQITIRTQTNASIFNSFGIGLLRSATVVQNLSDQIAPFLISSIPENDEINVLSNTNITLEFSEPIQNIEGLNIDDSNSENSIVLKNIDTDEILDYLISNSNNINFTITPDVLLPGESTIQVVLSNIQDTNGNPFQTYTIEFETEDTNPPQMENSGIASSNQFAFIEFNEGVYSTDLGVGGIQWDDLDTLWNPQAGFCESLSIIGLQNSAGQPLEGGETTVYIYMQLNGAPSGSETIEFFPADGLSIFDKSGNPLSESSTTSELTFNESAQISIVNLDSDNNYVDIQFSNGVYQDASQSGPLVESDFNIDLDINNGNATSVTIIDITDLIGDPLEGGENDMRLYLDFDSPSSGSERITISPFEDNQIYTSNGVQVPESEMTDAKRLNDMLPPDAYISDPDLDEAIDIPQSYKIPIAITDTLLVPAGLSDSEYLMSFMNLYYDDCLDPSSCFSVEIIDYPNDTGYVRISPENSYDSEEEIYFTFDGSLTDIDGRNQPIAFQVVFTIEDYLEPTIEDAVLLEDNSYIILEFNESIYGSGDGTGPISINDIQCEVLEPFSSNVEDCSVTSMTDVNGNPLIGGETMIRVYLNYDNTPNGGEVINLIQANGASVYDQSGNQFTAEVYAEYELYDILPPTVTEISFPVTSYLDLNQDKTISFTFNEEIASFQLDISSMVMDNISFTTDPNLPLPTDSNIESIDITLEHPYPSFDSVTVNFSNLTDLADCTAVDISFTYPTPMLGDLDENGKIDYDDIDLLIGDWNSYNYDLAPVTGSIPHYLVGEEDENNEDNQEFGTKTIEDGIIFAQMWSWYQKTYGEIILDTEQFGPILEIDGEGNRLFISIHDSIASGRIQLIYNADNERAKFENRQSKNGELFLSSDYPEKGYSILEFSRNNYEKNESIPIELEENSSIQVYYNLIDKHGSIFQKGNINIINNFFPTLVALYPSFPNPFNPVTTISFDIPKAEQINQVSLLIFDIQGKQIESLVHDTRPPGSYKIKWNAEKYASGMYFARLIYGEMVHTQKLILLK